MLVLFEIFHCHGPFVARLWLYFGYPKTLRLLCLFGVGFLIKPPFYLGGFGGRMTIPGGFLLPVREYRTTIADSISESMRLQFRGPDRRDHGSSRSDRIETP